MKPLGWVGVVLVVAGILALVFGGISYSHRKQIMKVGPIEATHTEKKTIPIPPIAGVACILVGGGIVVAGVRKR